VTKVLESSSGLSFRTQGDANAKPDPHPVPARAVRGQAVWAVPQLGRVITWLAWPRGFVLLFVAPAIVLLASELWARRRPADRVAEAASP
jgi:signal peptidase